jgi:nucleoside-diphosphate-sugar epimerase
MDHPLHGKTVFVTGAGGFFGSALALHLATLGNDVRALVRQTNRLVPHPKITVAQGDILNTTQMREYMQGCDVVFHAAAALRGPLAEQTRVNVDGTRNVVHAAMLNDVQRLVHISSVAIYGYRYGGVVDEAAPPTNTREPYSITKRQAEDVVRTVAEGHRLPYSIIRPGGIFGIGSLFWTRGIARLAQLDPMPLIGAGDGKAPVIVLQDVLDLTTLLATHPDAIGEAFNAVVDPSPTWRDYLLMYATHQNTVSIPPSLARLLAPIVERVFGRVGADEYIAFLQHDVQYSMAKARALLGWQPSITVRDGVQQSLAWATAQRAHKEA